jgi:hypothetical protein
MHGEFQDASSALDRCRNWPDVHNAIRNVVVQGDTPGTTVERLWEAELNNQALRTNRRRKRK